MPKPSYLRTPLEDLTYEEARDLKTFFWEGDVEGELLAVSAEKRILAEGDSWFDYPRPDILDHLKKTYNLAIKKEAKAGDTLENMAYGTKYRRNWEPKTKPIVEFIAKVKKYEPRVVLFSAGGNDLAGDELEGYLNHADSGLEPLRVPQAQHVIHVSMRLAYESFLNSVWSVDSGIDIIGHGYARPIADGRAVINVRNYRFFGPWLRPAFTHKRILDRSKTTEVMATLLNEFNRMLQDLDRKYSNYHYLDLRDSVKPEDWANELHPNVSTFGRIASKFHKEIQKHI